VLFNLPSLRSNLLSSTRHLYICRPRNITSQLNDRRRRIRKLDVCSQHGRNFEVVCFEINIDINVRFRNRCAKPCHRVFVMPLHGKLPDVHVLFDLVITDKHKRKH
jgi:hypothetical protein